MRAPCGLAGRGSLGSPRALREDAFLGTEAVISSGGIWITGDDDHQTPIQKTGGFAFGTQVGTEAGGGNFNDSEAYLQGFPPNHRISGVVHRSGTPVGYLEVELLLRWSVGSALRGVGFGDTHSDGYEVNFGITGQGFVDYFNVARFKDAGSTLYTSDDTHNTSDAYSTLRPLQDGDTIMTQIVGNVITVSLTRAGVTTVLCTVSDTAGGGGGAQVTSGQPGIGYFRQTIGGTPDTTSNFAWDSITAVGL